TNGLALLNGAVLDTANGTNGFNGNLYITATAAPTIAGNGQINFGTSSGYTNLYNYNTTNTLTIGPGILIHGKYGQFFNYFANDGGFVNNGTISADVAGGQFN